MSTKVTFEGIDDVVEFVKDQSAILDLARVQFREVVENEKDPHTKAYYKKYLDKKLKELQRQLDKVVHDVRRFIIPSDVQMALYNLERFLDSYEGWALAPVRCLWKKNRGNFIFRVETHAVYFGKKELKIEIVLPFEDLMSGTFTLVNTANKKRREFNLDSVADNLPREVRQAFHDINQGGFLIFEP